MSEALRAQGLRALTILHFNDVYQIEPGGDAERFAHKVKTYADRKPLLLFSGDCFAPSLLSITTKGVTVGIIGLAEFDWIATLAAVKPEEVQYKDFVAEGSQLAVELRAQGADVVIALTHSRRPNDIICARDIAGIDLVLGGHDHDYSLDAVQRPNGRTVHVVKSGTDFRQLSLITLHVPCQDLLKQAGGAPLERSPSPMHVEIERVEIARSSPADPGMREIAERYGDIMGKNMQKIIGETATDLDGRFATVRTQESNLGNWVADVWRGSSRADIVLLNSGTLRSDTIHQAGTLTQKDLMAILPMLDATVVIRVTGKDVVAALENGVSQYPKLEGRFLQVSGVKFKFDPSKPPGHRIQASDVWVTREEECTRIDLDATFTVATKLYMTSGKDGFECLQGREVVVDEEHGPTLPTIATNVFSQLRTLNLMTSKEQQVRRAVLKFQASMDRKSHPNVLNDNRSYVSIKHPLHGNYVIAPKCDGRIVCAH